MIGVYSIPYEAYMFETKAPRSLTIDFEIHLCEVENLWTGTYIQDNYIEEVYDRNDYIDNYLDYTIEIPAFTSANSYCNT